MISEMRAKEQSERDTNQENERPPVSNRRSQASGAQQKDDEDFVPVTHHDAEEHDEDMEDVDSDEAEMPSSPPGAGAGLQRMPGNLMDADEDSDNSFLNPLMSHLQGRLLNRLDRNRSEPNRFDPLHPYTTVLSLADVNECLRVETEAFPEHERCTREKFIYRLTKCPELCFGLFSRPAGSGNTRSAYHRSEAAKAKDDKIKAATAEAGKSELIALIIATRTPAPCVTDASMDFPKDWQKQTTVPPLGEDEPLGHQDQGSTICIHSLAVGKAHQKKGLGTTLLQAYVQRIKDSKIADRVALLAHDHLVKFYTNNGFEDMGESAATFGGGNWRNMVMEFGQEEDD